MPKLVPVRKTVVTTEEFENKKVVTTSPQNPSRTEPEDEAAVPLTFVKLFGGFQVLMIVLYSACTTYDENTGLDEKEPTGGAEMVSGKYGMWQDIHIMIFIGFGFLMTFLKSYGFSSLVLNFLVGAVAIMWGILTAGFFHGLWEANGNTADMHKIPLHLTQLVEGDFAAATALISLGAVLGKTTATQTLIMVVIELIFYSMNFQIIATSIGAADIGGTMAIHTFGAYFGLAFSSALTSGKDSKAEKPSKTIKDHPLNGSVYHSDMFSMVGTLFLWCFWPSFVAVLAEGNAQNRCVVHTVLALCASCLTGAVFSSWLRPNHKFDMVDLQNATLAGGVSIGAVADHYLGGGGAMAVGAAAGALSTTGYVYVQPWLEEKLGLYDTCGVHNLHGMPGVLGGLASVVSALFAGSHAAYGKEGAWAIFGELEGGRSPASQAAHQLAALFTTLAIALASGYVTGKICAPEPDLFDTPSEFFNDVTAFEVPDDGPVPAEAVAVDISTSLEDNSSSSLGPMTPTGVELPPFEPATDRLDDRVQGRPLNVRSLSSMSGAPPGAEEGEVGI